MNNPVTCGNGHIFDKALTLTCPVCPIIWINTKEHSTISRKNSKGRETIFKYKKRKRNEGKS